MSRQHVARGAAPPPLPAARAVRAGTQAAAPAPSSPPAPSARAGGPPIAAKRAVGGQGGCPGSGAPASKRRRQAAAARPLSWAPPCAAPTNRCVSSSMQRREQGHREAGAGMLIGSAMGRPWRFHCLQVWLHSGPPPPSPLLTLRPRQAQPQTSVRRRLDPTPLSQATGKQKETQVRSVAGPSCCAHAGNLGLANQDLRRLSNATQKPLQGAGQSMNDSVVEQARFSGDQSAAWGPSPRVCQHGQESCLIPAGQPGAVAGDSGGWAPAGHRRRPEAAGCVAGGCVGQAAGGVGRQGVEVQG